MNTDAKTFSICYLVIHLPVMDFKPLLLSEI